MSVREAEFIIKMFVSGPIETNCYAVTNNKSGETALIDPAFSSDEIDRFVDVNKNNIKAVYLTHGHFDHILKAADISAAANCPVYISAEDHKCLLGDSASGVSMVPGLSGIKTPADIKMVYDGDVLTLGNRQITVMSTPGHTKGSVCFISGDVIFSGDTLFYREIGRLDLPGGSAADMRTSLKKLTDLPGDYTVYPGHGEKTTMNEERRYNLYINGELCI